MQAKKNTAATHARKNGVEFYAHEAELMRLADLRLSTLQFLIHSPGYSSNIRLMRELLNLVGHKPSHESLVHELRWLCDRGCISITYHDDLIVIDLLKRGEDIGNGLTNIQGVALPTC